jgi:predicted GIY-YIG superfamily endonuclease
MKVYLLINDEGKFKIGFTDRDTQKRIKELNTGSHLGMRVVEEYESINAREIETTLHRLHRSNRIRLEWFDLSDGEVFDFKNRCRQIDNNINYLKENNTWQK